MLNKKLVIAALLAVALAETEEEKTARLAKEKEEAAAEKARIRALGRVFKKDLDGTGESVLCDRGEDALWQEALKQYKAAQAAHTKAKEAAVLADGAWDTQDKEVKKIKGVQTAHDTDASNLNYATELVNAKAEVSKQSGLVSTLEAKIGNKVGAVDCVPNLSTQTCCYQTCATALVTLNNAKAAATTAEGKVTAQIARISAMEAAQRTQSAEKARWTERKAASEAQVTELTNAENDASAWVTELTDQMNTISFLFQMLGNPIGQTTNWPSGCEDRFNSSKKCQLAENVSTRVAGTSPWEWQDCSKTTDVYAIVGAVASGDQCMKLGLLGTGGSVNQSDSLQGKAQSRLGLNRVVTDATNGVAPVAGTLHAALEAKDYNSKYQAQGTGTTAEAKSNLTLAKEAYVKWMKDDIIFTMLEMGCWQSVQSGDQSVLQADKAECHYDMDTAAAGIQVKDLMTSTQPGTTDVAFQPIIHLTGIQYFLGDGGSVVGSKALRDDFDGKDSTSVVITASSGIGDGTHTARNAQAAIPATEIKELAVAMANAWFGQWVVDALVAEEVWVGNTADKAVRETSGNTEAQWGAIGCIGRYGFNSGCAWTASEMSTATIAKDAATALKTANAENTAALTEYIARSTAEVSAFDTDVSAAQALLTSLTKEIAPTVRVSEYFADEAFRAAIKDEVDHAEAVQQLGNAGDQTNATGARLVEVIAQKAVTSVADQKAFHDARLDWAQKILDPLLEAKTAADNAEKVAKAVEEAALERWESLRANCKVAAFNAAQKLRAEQVAAAATAEADAAAIKESYASKSKFATGGAAGSLCQFPKKTGDTQEDRVECAEELCCGAAQRFLKDGTKLTIETCQKPETTTYTYWPELKEGALVEPLKETWRFQCISAAHKLAAAATAALAAGYMMA